jgi:hypothetical protein
MLEASPPTPAVWLHKVGDGVIQFAGNTVGIGEVADKPIADIVICRVFTESVRCYRRVLPSF